ncbi:MAG: head GIN domain-containing protein [Flavobacteriales bacterium]
MRKITVLCAAFALATQAQAQLWSHKTIRGNHREKTETRIVSDYEGISVAGGFEVHLFSGKEGTLTVKADENVLPYIVTKIKNKILYLGLKRGYNFRNIKYLSANVPVEQIESLRLTGSSDIDSDFTLKSPRMEIVLSGSGDMNLALNSDTTKARITGSGDMDIALNSDVTEAKITGSGELKLSGQTRNVNYTLTGSGDISALEFKAITVRAEITGSGDIYLYCREKLEARIAGSGDISYKGDPKIRVKISGSGSISNY